MADRTTVTIAGGELAGAATWKLSLVGELHGKWGGIDAGDFFAADALRVDDGSGVQRLFAKLPHAVELPGWIFTEAGDGLRASPNAFAQGRVALRARLDDALRRLRSVEIAWHEQEGGFFAAKGLGKVGAQLGGQLTLRFEAPQNGDAFVVVAELSARTTVTALIAGSAQAECSYGFTAILRAELKPRLRLDLDELSIGLPEIPFALDLGRIAAPFELDQGITLQGLLQGLPVKVTATADQAMLAIVLTDGRLRWAVCKAGTPADQQLDPANRAALTVTIGEAAGPRLDIQNLTVADDGDTTPVLSATVSGSIDQTIGDGQQRFGPLVVRWQGAEATFRGAAAAGGPGDVSAVLELRVQRLMLYPADDPEAVLAFSVTLEITPVGARVKALQLLEPLPLDLLAGAAQELSRAASKVLRLLFDLFPAGQLPEAEIQRLLDVLSRIAAAVGRAAVFVADQAGEIAAAAGELIGRVLAGIGEVVGALLRALRQLAAKDAASRVTVALYVGTDPLELRQVLVTLRGPATAPRTIGVLGCHLELAPGWRPGLLIDLVAQPGAYLVATHDAAPNGAIATLSTDLWLARPAKGPVQNLPDVDPKTGGRAQQDGAGDKPLLAVALSWAAATSARQAIVLVGIGRGEPVFLQRITSPLAPTTGNEPVAIVAGGAFSYRELGLNPDGSLDFSVEPTFATDRILPLLGMSDRGTPAPGGPAGDSFLNRLRDSLSPVVTVLAVTSDVHELLKPRLVVQLLVHVARLETKVDLKLELDLRTFRANLDADMSEVQVQSPPLAEKALGLLWIVKKKGDASPPGQPASDPTPFEMFRLSFEGPESVLALGENAKMEIAYDALSTDGRGVVFDVTEFRVDRSGLNLRTAVSKAPVRLSGIDQPFEFTSGGLEIRSGRLVQAAIAGRGTLPPALVGDASCAVALVFATDAAGAIELQSATVELDKKGEPIICHGPRFQLTIDELGLSFVRDNGDHFYFVVTGALQFAPKPGEFESGLLQSFKNVRIDLEKVPLAGDARVLARHISFQVAMNPKKRFPLFNLFTFELRGIGFHPSAPKFDGDPAINVSGQIAFVPIGDVMQPKIDFHGLWIAPPKPGQALPRLRADGLGVEVAFGGAAKLRGAVVAVDEKMPTLEGAEAAPPDYKAYGFLGEGQVSIQGFATLSASMGFLEVEKNDAPGERKKAFFLFLQQEKVAYEIPTPVWTFYLREVGFGFGYRYTLRSFREADRATSPAQLISALDKASKTQGELSRFSAWEPDPDGDKLTLALRGAFQMYPAQKTFDAKREARAENPFFFDIVAALRSDLTFLISTRGWLATNYNDFFEDKDGLRSRPGFRGYLLISVPRSELLARVVADSKGYIGERLALPSEVRTALQSVDWSATLYIRPGLLHFELGWPDQLVVRLKDDPKFRVTVRGGLIFRAAEDGVLYGFNVEADAFLAFSGSAGGGSLGVAVEATLVARFVARLISFMSPKLSGSLLYGLISLDAQLTFSVRAWLRIDLRFTSFTITIGYSFSLQLTAVVEIAISTEGVGAKVRARVAICAFGCTLAVGIGFSINDARLDDARARVDRFLGMGLTAETPDPAKALSAQRADERMDRAAQQAVPPNGAGTSPSPEAQAEAGNGAPDGAPTSDVPGARAITATNFWLVLRRAETRPAGGDDQSDTWALLVPREPLAAAVPPSAFYSAPPPGADAEPTGAASAAPADYTLLANGVQLTGVKRWDPVGAQGLVAFPGNGHAQTRWHAIVPSDRVTTGAPDATLALLARECFVKSGATLLEPPARRHVVAERLDGDDEQRNAERDLHQRDRVASATRNGRVLEGVYDARTTMLTQLLDQFATLARTGERPAGGELHVTDLGLVFFGPVAELEKLAGIQVEKRDAPGALGTIEVFNPRRSWFDVRDPVLANGRQAVQTDGIKLDWDLTTPWVEEMRNGAAVIEARLDPEQHLHCYEVVRTVEGLENAPRTFRIKPAATIGGTVAAAGAHAGAALHEVGTHGAISLFKPDWQFSDDLSDLTPAQRKALLPASSSDAAAFDAAAAWSTLFGGAEEVTITYTVTPIDVGDSRGLPRAFVVDVPRPQPPIRSADAELRVIVRDLGERIHVAARPDDVQVFLALKDEHWPKDELGNPLLVDLENGGRAARLYRLILDPEDIVPSGSFGADGLTERLRAPQSVGGLLPTGDESSYTFAARDGMPSKLGIPAARELEPDDETRAYFTHWLFVAGRRDSTGPTAGRTPLETVCVQGGPSPRDLLDVLWRRSNDLGGGRVATRVMLETIVRVSIPGQRPIDLVSRRTSVNVQISVPGPASAPVVLRPEAFEWPTRLSFPPLPPGAVRARSGFARFYAPRADAQLVAGRLAYVTLPDAERRVLTQVEWDAVPQWPASGAQPIAALHLGAIAGFDVHELDLVELAVSDTHAGAPGGAGTIAAGGAADEPPPLASDAAAWHRARRVARVQLERPSAAMLVPHDTEDLQSWRAHYPSETWRVSSLETDSEAKARGDARPTRAPWWSPREATIAWPRPVARRRLLIDPEESLIATLLAQGRPTDVTVRIAWQPRPGLLGASRTVVPHLCAFRVGDQALGAGFQQSVEDPTNPAAARLRVSLAGGFSASDLRRLLLCLAWEPSAASAGPDVAATAPQPAGPVTGVAQDGAVDEAYAASVEVLDDFSLVLRAERRDGDGIHLLQEAVAPVSFRSPLHAVLEETVAAMALDVRRSGNALSVYRRYTVQVQPSAPVEDADLATFLRTRPHEKDPYGWGVLQSLGLAAVLRSYDGDGDDFEAPASLHDRLAAASREVLERYAGVHDAQGGSPLLERLGAPFAEVLLRPGSDRSAGSFDALPAASPEEPTLRLDDDGLALLQLSLRPTPADGWSYLGLAMRWRGDPAKPAPTGLALRFQPSTAAVKYDVLYLADGRVLTVDAESGERVVPLAGRRTPHHGPSDRRADRELTVVVRWPAHLAPPELGSTIELVRVAHADGTPVVPPTGVDLRELTDVIHPDGGDSTVFWAIEPDTMPGEFSGAEVFERFPLKSATEWLQPFTGPSAAARAFATFAQLLRRAHPGLAFPTLTGTGSDTAAAAAAAASEETLALYLPWSQRFLDHGRAERDLPPAAPSLALAAPEHQMPWRLAAAADGTLMASFLHADRWGHARAFAVKPVGRYQEIMVGAGALPREESEALLTPDLLLDPSQGSLVKQRLRYEIGYAVAVSPRTERLETPVVLGSVRRRAADRPAPAAGADDVDDAWELVVARHPDESLAFANRPLFARLGWEGIALGFVREYADAAWPSRLRELTGALEVETHPAQAVQLPALPDDRRALGPRALGALAREYPSLWKGADVYRFRSLPYFYRVTALATARAGIVVSPIATVTHEDFPSRLPKRTAPLMIDGDELLDPEMTDEQKNLLRCTTSVGHDDAAATSFLRVGFPLLRYADLLDTATRATWLPDGGPAGGTAPPADDEALDATPNPERNVGWLPDPAVAYVLLRTTRLSDGTALEEEDAEVRLIADEVHPSAGDQPAAPARPVVVRARGTRFAERPPLPALQPGDPGRPRVTMRSIAGRARLFRMEAQLIRRPRASAAALESAALAAAAAGSPEQRLAFNQMAARYAVLSAAHELTIGVALDPGDDDDAVRAKLRTLESDLDARLAKLVASLPVLPSHQARAIDDLRVPLQALLRRLDAAAGSADPRTHAGLPARVVVSWPDATEPPEPLRDLSAPSSFTRAPDDAASYRIALVDLPTDDEIADLVKAFPASAKVGFAALVTRLAKRALLGAAQGFTLRVLRPGNAAVDWPVELPAWADDDEHRDGGASDGTGDTNEGEGAAG